MRAPPDPTAPASSTPMPLPVRTGSACRSSLATGRSTSLATALPFPFGWPWQRAPAVKPLVTPTFDFVPQTSEVSETSEVYMRPPRNNSMLPSRVFFVFLGCFWLPLGVGCSPSHGNNESRHHGPKINISDFIAHTAAYKNRSITLA